LKAAFTAKVEGEGGVRIRNLKTRAENVCALTEVAGAMLALA
jgi:hypothetical protein